MVKDIATQLNWLDLIVIIIIIRTTYIGFVKGFSVEIFKFLGILTASIICIHYYSYISNFILNIIKFDKVIIQTISFVVLFSCSVFLFSSLFNLFCRFVRIEASSNFNKWGGCFIGGLRGFFVSGLIIIGLSLTNIAYLSSSIGRSITATKLFDLSFNTYRLVWSGIMIKFFPEEDVNYSVFEKAQDKNKKK